MLAWLGSSPPGASFAQAPYIIKDLNLTSQPSNPSALTDVNGTLYFTAFDPLNGTELWKSDGTAAGTTLVKDIYPGADGSYPAFLTNVNGTLFFRANDGTKGRELWKSDGTAAGTTLVKDIYPGAGGSGPSPAPGRALCRGSHRGRCGARRPAHGRPRR